MKHVKILILRGAINICADQTAHQRSLVCAFVVRMQ